VISLDHGTGASSNAQARLMESAGEGSITLVKLTAMVDRPVAQDQGKTAVEAVKAMTGQKWSKLLLACKTRHSPRAMVA
jgi:hypothetical protein